VSDINVVLNVHFEAAAGQEEELFEQLRALVAPTRAEPGCLVYELHRDPENPAKFMFYERFRNQEALDAHAATPHLERWKANRAAAKVDPVGSVVLTKWRVVE
jgi:quinol monooxygenase YgiN